MREMTINLNVKVKAGPRTPIEVSACSTSVNEKLIKLSNGRTVSDRYLAKLLEEVIMDMLKELVDTPTAEASGIMKKEEKEGEKP